MKERSPNLSEASPSDGCMPVHKNVLSDHTGGPSSLLVPAVVSLGVSECAPTALQETGS